MRNSRDEVEDRLLGIDLEYLTKRAVKKYNNMDKIIRYNKTSDIKNGSTQSDKFSDTIKLMAAGNHIMTHGGVGR